MLKNLLRQNFLFKNFYSTSPINEKLLQQNKKSSSYLRQASNLESLPNSKFNSNSRNSNSLLRPVGQNESLLNPSLNNTNSLFPKESKLVTTSKIYKSYSPLETLNNFIKYAKSLTLKEKLTSTLQISNFKKESTPVSFNKAHTSLNSISASQNKKYLQGNQINNLLQTLSPSFLNIEYIQKDTAYKNGKYENFLPQKNENLVTESTFSNIEESNNDLIYKRFISKISVSEINYEAIRRQLQRSFFFKKMSLSTLLKKVYIVLMKKSINRNNITFKKNVRNIILAIWLLGKENFKDKNLNWLLKPRLSIVDIYILSNEWIKINNNYIKLSAIMSNQFNTNKNLLLPNFNPLLKIFTRNARRNKLYSASFPSLQQEGTQREITRHSGLDNLGRKNLMLPHIKNYTNKNILTKEQNSPAAPSAPAAPAAKQSFMSPIIFLGNTDGVYRNDKFSYSHNQLFQYKNTEKYNTHGLLVNKVIKEHQIAHHFLSFPLPTAGRLEGTTNNISFLNSNKEIYSDINKISRYRTPLANSINLLPSISNKLDHAVAALKPSNNSKIEYSLPFNQSDLSKIPAVMGERLQARHSKMLRKHQNSYSINRWINKINKLRKLFKHIKLFNKELKKNYNTNITNITNISSYLMLHDYDNNNNYIVMNKQNNISYGILENTQYLFNSNLFMNSWINKFYPAAPILKSRLSLPIDYLSPSAPVNKFELNEKENKKTVSSFIFNSINYNLKKNNILVFSSYRLISKLIQQKMKNSRALFSFPFISISDDKSMLSSLSSGSTITNTLSHERYEEEKNIYEKINLPYTWNSFFYYKKMCSEKKNENQRFIKNYFLGTHVNLNILRQYKFSNLSQHYPILSLQQIGRQVKNYTEDWNSSNPNFYTTRQLEFKFFQNDIKDALLKKNNLMFNIWLMKHIKDTKLNLKNIWIKKINSLSPLGSRYTGTVNNVTNKSFTDLNNFRKNNHTTRYLQQLEMFKTEKDKLTNLNIIKTLSFKNKINKMIYYNDFLKRQSIIKKSAEANLILELGHSQSIMYNFIKNIKRINTFNSMDNTGNLIQYNVSVLLRYFFKKIGGALISKPIFIYNNKKVIIKLYFYLKKNIYFLSENDKKSLHNLLLKRFGWMKNSNFTKWAFLKLRKFNKNKILSSIQNSVKDNNHLNLLMSRSSVIYKTNKPTNLGNIIPLKEKAEYSTSWRWQLTNKENNIRQVLKKGVSRISSKLFKNRLNQNILYIFKKEFNILTLILEKYFNTSINLEITRIYYPFFDSNILSQIIGLNGKYYHFYKIMSLLLNRIKIRNPKKALNKIPFVSSNDQSLHTVTEDLILTQSTISSSYGNEAADGEKVKKLQSLFRQNKISGMRPVVPMMKKMISYLSGLNIKVAGRFYKHRIIPRKTVSSSQRGSLARGVVNFVDSSRYINKSKRGTFSVTVKISHIY